MKNTWVTYLTLRKPVEVETDELVSKMKALRIKATGQEADVSSFDFQIETEGSCLKDLSLTSQCDHLLNTVVSEIWDPTELVQPLLEALKPDETAWVDVDMYDSDYFDQHFLLKIENGQCQFITIEQAFDWVVEYCANLPVPE